MVQRFRNLPAFSRKKRVAKKKQAIRQDQGACHAVCVCGCTIHSSPPSPETSAVLSHVSLLRTVAPFTAPHHPLKQRLCKRFIGGALGCTIHSSPPSPETLVECLLLHV